MSVECHTRHTRQNKEITASKSCGELLRYCVLLHKRYVSEVRTYVMLYYRYYVIMCCSGSPIVINSQDDKVNGMSKRSYSNIFFHSNNQKVGRD